MLGAEVSEQPDGTEDQNQKNNGPSSIATSVATHTRTIDIIHPPADIKSIIDKTARLLVKSEPGFETRIAAKNTGNDTFNFLKPLGPHHAYYQYRLSQIRAHNQAPTQQPAPSQSFEPSTPKAGIEKPDPLTHFGPDFKVLELPDAEKYIVRLPEGITECEVDIIKLTAQFAAINGMSFFTSEELKDLELEFLQETRCFYKFFKSHVDAYSQVPLKGMTDEMRNSVTDKTTLLGWCSHWMERQQSFTDNCLPAMPPLPLTTINPPGIDVLTSQPVSQSPHLSAPWDVIPMSTQPRMHMMAPPPLPQGVMPPPAAAAAEKALPPLPPEPEPEPEPEPKRLKLDDFVLIPEKQFPDQHSGPVRVFISVPNVDKGNSERKVLEIAVDSLPVTVSSLKEKIAREIQRPSNKLQLRGKTGILCNDSSPANFYVAGGEALDLSVKERGGRKQKKPSSL